MTDEIETPHELVLQNRFAASPAEVYAAWTEPERFAAWYHGPGFRLQDVTLDVRPGGEWHARMISEDETIDLPFDGFYRETVPGERLVLTLNDPGTPIDGARSELTVTFHADGDGTQQRFVQTGVISDEHFEALKAGTMLFFEGLAGLLQEH